MLDSQIKSQLTEVFSVLENEISLVYKPSNHENQAELLEMLMDVQSTCPQIKVEEDKNNAGPSSGPQVPQFSIYYKGQPNGIIIKGIPGGHEFTSLILAILHSDHKGKLPDPKLIERIKNLKGPIHLTTYFSLTCENCPEVVQALNLMAIFNTSFTHTMVDGAYAQAEIARLGIQGVPSVVSNDQLIHSGRSHLLELIGKMEQVFGTSPAPTKITNEDLGFFDVTVVGGGPAGASAAIYSARKGLKTLLIAEKMGGQVQETKGIENLISIPYTEGPELAQKLVQHLSHYPIKIIEYQRIQEVGPNVGQNDLTRVIKLESGDFLKTKSLIVATGAKWRELNITGEKEYLGRGVAFCPHCDGPFYKGKKVAVIGGGNSGVEAAIDLAGLVQEVVVLEYNQQLKADQILIEKLQSLKNVSIIVGAQTQQILGDGHKVTELEYLNRSQKTLEKIKLDGVFIQIGLIPNSQFLKGVVELSPFGEIIIDTKCRTSVKGIYAAGDVTTVPFKQIIIAMGEGAKAALTVFEDMMLH